MKPTKVWVLYGGESAERDVSVKSGSNIVAALKDKGFEVKALEFQSRKEIPAFFATEKPDIVFLGLHGTFGEDGTIQGYLETLDIPYVGSRVLSSAICFNKLTTQKILKHHKIPIPAFVEINGEDFKVDNFQKENPDILNKKCFIKAASQGSTLGVFRYDPSSLSDAERKKTFEGFCQQAFRFDSEVIVEQWIEGREFTVPIILGEAFPVIEIRPNSKFYDYKSKYTSGETEYLCPAPLDEKITAKIQKSCEAAFKYLKCSDYARIDVMMNAQEEFFILEANTLPGMTNTSLVPKSAKAKGIPFESFIEFLVTKSFERQQK